MADCTATQRDGVYNCFGNYNKTMCQECDYNSDATEKTGSKFKSYEDAIDEFREMLKGLGLGNAAAFGVIYYLQERMCILPDCIEKCEGCGGLFDTDSEGYCLSDDYCLVNKAGKPSKRDIPKKYWGHFHEGCLPINNFDLK